MEVATVERGFLVVFFCRIAMAWCDAFNLIDLRLFHAFEELARVGGERFDVSPLALGLDGVERQGRLARTGYARDDR